MVTFNSMAIKKRAVKPKSATTSKKTVKKLPQKASKEAVSKPKEKPPIPKIKCSFCGKSTDTARQMVASPPPVNAYICDECIFVCIKILSENTPKEVYHNLGLIMSMLEQKIRYSSKGAKKPNARL